MRARLRRAAAVLTVLVLLTSCAGQVRPSPGVLAPGYFVAADIDSVDVVSAATGQVQRRVTPAARGRRQVNGVALVGQTLFVTYAAWPRCSSGIAGCGPVPDSCGAEVDRFDLRTGARTVVWKVGSDTLLVDAEPSPDLTRIAALTSPCVPSYFNQHLVVRTVADGSEVTIGAGLPRCHLLADPRWTGDGTRLLVRYAAPVSPWTGADGVCSELGPIRLVDLDGATAQPGLEGSIRPAPKGCQYESIGARVNDVYTVVSCGSAGRAVLQHLNGTLVPDHTWALGGCSDDSAVAVSPDGEVLVADYQSCTPRTVLYRVTDGTLTRVSAVTLGTRVPGELTW